MEVGQSALPALLVPAPMVLPDDFHFGPLSQTIAPRGPLCSAANRIMPGKTPACSRAATRQNKVLRKQQRDPAGPTCFEQRCYAAGTVAGMRRRLRPLI
jgi:hypothetical protein